MAKKHWHLTNDPGKAAQRGNAIEHKQDAEELAKWARRQSKHPVYVQACYEKHGQEQES